MTRSKSELHSPFLILKDVLGDSVFTVILRFCNPFTGMFLFD